MLKSTEDVNLAPEEAKPMELMCAAIDAAAATIRAAINLNDREALLEALACMGTAVEMIRRWTENGTH